MAGTVITIAQQKGGAGKTTLAAHLAIAWAGQGHRVALVDIDPQGSLAAWHSLREERLGEDRTGIDFAAITGWRTAAEVERRARDHDIIVIDSPPHAETEARLAIRAADLVVLPVQPSPMDVWATRPTLDLAAREKVTALLVLNRVPPRANLTDSMLAKLAELGATVADARIGNRVALAAALAEGLGISEAAPGSRAAEEIAAAAAEILLRAKGIAVAKFHRAPPPARSSRAPAIARECGSNAGGWPLSQLSSAPPRALPANRTLSPNLVPSPSGRGSG
jgi:chromosome partitioning protein